MRSYERVKGRCPEGKTSLSRDWHCLNEEHVLGPARCINARTLRDHLVLDHGVMVRHRATPKQLGTLHLLAHTLMTFSELNTLLELDKVA